MGFVALRLRCTRPIVLVCRRLSRVVLGIGRHRWVRAGVVLAGVMRGLFCWFGVVFASFRSACWGGFRRRLGCRCGCAVCLAGVGVVVLRGPPSWWGLLCWCLAPPILGRAVLLRGPPPRWGVLCRCALPPMVGRAVLAHGPPHGRACCVVVGPPSWWGVLCWCVAPLMVGHAVLVPARRAGCAWCGGAGLGWSSSVPPADWRRWVRVGGVLSGPIRGLFYWFSVVYAALRPACSGGCGWWSGCGCGCVVCLTRVGAVLVRGPPYGGVCCVGAWAFPW